MICPVLILPEKWTCLLSPRDCYYTEFTTVVMKAHQKAFSRFLSACFVHTLLCLFASMHGVIITPPSLWFLSFSVYACVCVFAWDNGVLTEKEQPLLWFQGHTADTFKVQMASHFPMSKLYPHTRTGSQSYTWKGRNFLSRKIRSAELCWILFYTRLSLCATRGYLCIVFSCFCYICLFFAFWDSHLITIIITVHNPPD